MAIYWYHDLCDYVRIDGDTERYIFSQYGLESLIGDPSIRLRTSKSHGYTLIPDYIEDMGGWIEPLTKVRRRNQLCLYCLCRVELMVRVLGLQL
jgi:hypothetical protein